MDITISFDLLKTLTPIVFIPVIVIVIMTFIGLKIYDIRTPKKNNKFYKTYNSTVCLLGIFLMVVLEIILLGFCISLIVSITYNKLILQHILIYLLSFILPVIPIVALVKLGKKLYKLNYKKEKRG